LTTRRLNAFQVAELHDEEVRPQGAMEMKNRTKVVAALIFALGGMGIAFAQQKSFTGVVTDSMCGATHMAKDKTPAECTRICVKDGMKYALAADKKLYTLEGHETELSRLAGQRVMVKGILKGDMLSVQEVAASK